MIIGGTQKVIEGAAVAHSIQFIGGFWYLSGNTYFIYVYIHEIWWFPLKNCEKLVYNFLKQILC